MSPSANVARQQLLSALFVAPVVWAAVTMGWRIVDGLPALAAQSATWYQHHPATSLAATFVVAVVVIGAMAAAQVTRHVTTLSGAAAVGLLVAVVSVPVPIALAITAGIQAYGWARGAVLAIGLVGGSIAVFLVRRALTRADATA
jgi:hypothetical protein